MFGIWNFSNFTTTHLHDPRQESQAARLVGDTLRNILRPKIITYYSISDFFIAISLVVNIAG